MFDFKKAPVFGLGDLVGSLLVSIGIILFLTTLHLMVLGEGAGDTQDVLLTTFTTMLKLAIGAAVTMSVFIMFYVIRVMVYLATTPKWLREEHKERRQRR